jgi:ASC-1-like (ASCH) protein
MEKVSVDKRREVWEEVLEEEAVEEIYSSHSSEEEKLHSCADIYVTCKPDSSWEELVRELYNWGEMAAAKEAKAFLQQKGWWFIDGS